jgi:hypothetical protein
MKGNLWRPGITMHKIRVGGDGRGLLFMAATLAAVLVFVPTSLREVPTAWYFLALFFVIAVAGGLGFAAFLQHLYRRNEGVMDENRWLVITVPKIGIGDGLLCLLFVAACIWAFVFGGGWFQCFYLAAVAGGSLIALRMHARRRVVDRLWLPKSTSGRAQVRVKSQAG